MRKVVWDFLGSDPLGPSLIKMVETIAIGATVPPPLRSFAGCPSAINYLANGSPPTKHPKGLGGLLSGLIDVPSGSAGFGCGTLGALKPLYDAKASTPLVTPTDEQLCGFDTGGMVGLSILLGGWVDFCLWCWALHPSKQPITLILGTDDNCFYDYLPLAGGVDYGEAEAASVLKFTDADKSTNNLFGCIWKKANLASGLPKNPEKPSLIKLVNYIGTQRLLVVNAWPWHRIGIKSHGTSGRHEFSGNSIVRDLLRAFAEMNISKVIGLGSEYVEDAISTGPADWFRAIFDGNVHVTYHPSAREWQALGCAELYKLLP